MKIIKIKKEHIEEIERLSSKESAARSAMDSYAKIASQASLNLWRKARELYPELNEVINRRIVVNYDPINNTFQYEEPENE